MNKILFPSPLFFIYHNFHFLPKESQKIKEKGVLIIDAEKILKLKDFIPPPSPSPSFSPFPLEALTLTVIIDHQDFWQYFSFLFFFKM